jgi:phosphoribosyl 1,2-cyclic phosphate phosphodiesterase
LKVTFLGTGTSQGVPVIACDCAVCHSNDSNDKRLRSSVLIEVEGKVFVIDTGPDFRQQMLRENVKRVDAIFFTHEHKDHIAGLDDIRSFNWIYKKSMDIYAEERVLKALQIEYSYVFAEDKYPGIPKMTLHSISEKPFNVMGIEIIPIRALHYKLPVLGFRIGEFAYITDAKTIPESEYEKLKGLKYFVINALRKKEHISHLNLAEAIEISKKVGAEHSYLTHISHMMGFHDEIEKELPENVYLAFDGLTLVS